MDNQNLNNNQNFNNNQNNNYPQMDSMGVWGASGFENNDNNASPTDYQPNKQSETVIGLAKVMLVLSLIAGVVCFIGCSGEHRDTLKIVFGVIGGYCIMQGLLIFAIIYGVGHILRHNEEMDKTTKEMNQKIDQLMRK